MMYFTYYLKKSFKALKVMKFSVFSNFNTNFKNSELIWKVWNCKKLKAGVLKFLKLEIRETQYSKFIYFIISLKIDKLQLSLLKCKQTFTCTRSYIM